MKHKKQVKKKAKIKSWMSPIAMRLKPSTAASIGRTIMRHAYLEWIQAGILHRLLEISIKQGRVAVKIPRPHQYGPTIKDLAAFQGIKIRFKFADLKTKLDAAERARNILAHSIYLKDGNKTLIQIVRGNWDLPKDTETINRALKPETPIVDRTFLTKQRVAVEPAIRSASKLDKTVSRSLETLRKKRQTNISLDRRQSGSQHQPQR